MKNGFSILCWVTFLIFVLFSGCSMYQNVTGYFNTFYNAKKFFSDAEKEMRQAPQKDLDTNYFAAFSVPTPTQAKFDKVVEKCSKLIQFYPASTWVDDAILMIAKSDMYLQDYESSIRKSKELQENFSTSDLRFEAKLIEAKDYYLQKKDDFSLKIAKELIPELRAEGKNDLLLESVMLQAQIYWDRGEFDQAAQNYSLAIEVSGNDVLRAFSCYQLGVCYEKSGDKERAADAYSRVTQFSPGFDMEFRSRLKFGAMLSETGKHDRALRILDDLNGEVLRPDQHGLVDLEIANAYRIIGDTAVAFSMHNLIDTVYRRTEASANSMFLRGLYYEMTLHDYKTARKYYSNAKAEYQNSQYFALATKKATDLDRYFAFLDDLHRCNKILYPDSSHGKSEHPDSLHHDNALNSKGDKVQENEDVAAQHEPEPESQDLRETNSPVTDNVSGGESAYARRNADRDVEPDDEETDVLQPTPASISSRSDKRTSKSDTTRKAKSLLTSSKVSQVLSPDSARSLMTRTYYELGTLFYLQFGLTDSAQSWYHKLLEEYPYSSYAPRTVFVLAEMQVAAGDLARADSLYGILLYCYAESPFAQEVKKVKGMETRVESQDISEIQFRKGEKLLQSGNTQGALKEFKKIREGTHRSPYISKAQYTVGWIYESMLLENDSAETWYRRVMKEDSTSIYAMAVAPKVHVKEKPENIKQFVKVNEIEDLSKTKKPQERRRHTDEATKNNENDDENNTNVDESQQLREDEDNSNDEDEETQDQSDDNSDDDN